MRSLEERLWGRAERTESGCLIFGDGSGYGRIKRPGERVGAMAHRVAYELAVGPIPDGMLVLHHCDTPPCIKPAHLFVGTYADNTADMYAKQRQRGGWGAVPACKKARGEQHGFAKLTAEDVVAIRTAAANGERFVSIARRFPVGRQSIANIVYRIRWAHVP